MLGKDTGRILELHSMEHTPAFNFDAMPLHPLYNYMLICGSGAYVHIWFPEAMAYINANFYENTFSPFNTQESPERACRTNLSPLSI